MYDDYPEWKVYLNTLEAMYHNHPVKLDITGTIETISHIDKEVLYKCYNTFYNPSNMVLVVCGDFKPDEIIEEIKKRLVSKEASGEIKRIYPEEPKNIVKSYVEQKMEVSMPLFTIGIKDTPSEEKVRKHIAVEILLNMLLGKSSKLYKELYGQGIIFNQPSLEYEFTDGYAHILITGQATEPQKVSESLKNEIEYLKDNGLNEDEFNRIKKMIYGGYVKEYNDVAETSRMFLADFFKGINSFDYIDEIESVKVDYVYQVLKETFDDNNMVLSVVKK